MSIPKDCKKERLCEFMLKTIGDCKEFYLAGTIHSTEMSLKAAISGTLNLSSSLTLEEAYFEVIAGTKQTSSSLNGMVRMTRDGKELTFAGKLSSQ